MSVKRKEMNRMHKKMDNLIAEKVATKMCLECAPPTDKIKYWIKKIRKVGKSVYGEKISREDAMEVYIESCGRVTYENAPYWRC